jgi:hypothetical protein
MLRASGSDAAPDDDYHQRGEHTARFMSLSREDDVLAEHIERGHRLIRDATTIRNLDDFRVWRAERNTWIWTTAEALERWHGPEIADSIRHSPGQPTLTEEWRSDALTDELARVNRVLARLYELELAEDPARRATLRAAQRSDSPVSSSLR